MEIVKYGILTSGQVVKEVSKYTQAGTGVISETDSRLVSLPGEVGLWLLCCVSNKLPDDAIETDEATYTQHKQDAIDAGLSLGGNS